MKGFFTFIREQGVIGLAVGFLLGGAVSKFVASFVTDIINPMVGILLGRAGDLKSMYFAVGGAKIRWGNFMSSFIDFVIIAAVVYFVVRGLGLHKLDLTKKKK